MPKDSLSYLRDMCASDTEELRDKTPTQFRPMMDRDALVWLLNGNIHPRLWVKYNIQQEVTGHVCIELREFGSPVGWIRRKVYDGVPGPKYLVTGKKSFYGIAGSDSAVVVVEDCLSAIHVHESTGLTTVSILGTGKNLHAQVAIASRTNNVIVWLDSDKAGTTASDKFIKEMRAYNCAVAEVCTEQDPKKLSREEINRNIKGATDELGISLN